MTPRRRALLILGLILLLVAIIVIVVVLLLRRAAPAEPAPVPVEETVTETFEEPPPLEEEFVNPLTLADPEVIGATGSRQMAELFAERYGSYSTQGDYQNLRDLLPVMTASYRAEIEEMLREAPSDSGRSFEGVTSVRVSTDVRSSDEDSAVIAVSLQQEKTSGGSVSTGYRTLRMELERVGGDWRVDSAAWED